MERRIDGQVWKVPAEIPSQVGINFPAETLLPVMNDKTSRSKRKFSEVFRISTNSRSGLTLNPSDAWLWAILRSSRPPEATGSEGEDG